jgi:hypothetical protein
MEVMAVQFFLAFQPLDLPLHTFRFSYATSDLTGAKRKTCHRFSNALPEKFRSAALVEAKPL